MGMYSINEKHMNNFDYVRRDNSNVEINIKDVWYANIPYADRPGDFEDRPCIVIRIIPGRTSPIDYCVVKCTTQEDNKAMFKTTIDTDIEDKCKWVVCDYEYYITKRHFRRYITTISQDDLDTIIWHLALSQRYNSDNIPDYYDRALRMKFDPKLI